MTEKAHGHVLVEQRTESMLELGTTMYRILLNKLIVLVCEALSEQLFEPGH